jgi:hypothetical protein
MMRSCCNTNLNTLSYKSPVMVHRMQLPGLLDAHAPPVRSRPAVDVAHLPDRGNSASFVRFS